MNENQMRARVAELRGWSEVMVLSTGEWIGISPSGVAGKHVPDYSGDVEIARKLKKIIEEGNYSVSIRQPAAPGGLVRARIDIKGWGTPAPQPPGGIYYEKTEAMAICAGYIVWAEWIKTNNKLAANS